MLTLYAMAALAAACWQPASATPEARLASAFAGRRTFSLRQVAVNVAARGPWHGPTVVQRAYLKYGLEVPPGVARAAARLELQRQRPALVGGNGKTSVPVRPAPNDVEFLVPVEVATTSCSWTWTPARPICTSLQPQSPLQLPTHLSLAPLSHRIH